MFELFGSEIGLTSNDVLKIMAEADNNDDGVIEYKEFLPVATEIIQVRFLGEPVSHGYLWYTVAVFTVWCAAYS